jgi:hypothetical protein
MSFIKRMEYDEDGFKSSHTATEDVQSSDDMLL